MARRTRAPKLETRTARLKLPVRKKPHSLPIAPGVILQYRRNKGSGAWGVRLTEGGKDQTHRLATADDYAEANGRDLLDFWQAQDAARAKAKEHEGDAEPATVLKALDDYESDLKTRGGDIGNVTRARSHLPSDMLARTISSLNAGEFKRWRDRLAKSMAPASVNRTATCFRAALNLAADHDERIARRPWETGLQAIRGAERSRNVILDDATVREIVAEAYTPVSQRAAQLQGEQRRKPEDEARRWADAFGVLVEVAAVTGARVSQLARLEAQDVQGDRSDPRLMMPSSRKGQGVKQIERRPVPISATVALRLRALAADRPHDAPLLVKPGGARWSRSDHLRFFARVIKRLQDRAREKARERGADDAAVAKAGAELDDVTANALRHSSIVRQLLAGVPIRVVASVHDTSVAMIEKTYSRFIADHADVLARRALLDTSAPAGGNVVRMGAGA
jgi:integrase